MSRRSVDEHAAHIAALAGPALADLGAEHVPLASALGRVLAADVRSPVPLPPFRNSQMDGWAARADEVAHAPVALPTAGVQAAGPAAPRTLPLGAVLKVMTGAPVPEGADCVIPVEDTDAEGDLIRILVPRRRGEFVREAGSDLAAGAVVGPTGAVLTPRRLAALAASGIATVAVRRKVRVAVLTTGEEVVAPGRPLEFGQVYDANEAALVALLGEAGAESLPPVRTPDDPAAFAAALDAAVAAADLVLTSGGISHGDFEVVRQVLEPRGAEVVEIAMQPGGPQATALIDGVPVIGFPGNPVSTQVSFTVLVRPLLRAAAGLPPIEAATVPLAVALDSPAGRRQWLRGRIEHGRAVPVGGPSSHLVATMADADVLLDVPADTTHLEAGDPITALPL
ncbi:MAG TPA: gephyrin-like molybdotransferase Glp [Amnibacterium sp.]|uniref:molybdopterin molybdotransferase MoeA n=1 Tax=Amnibacterium sp. TaxID=1872496 RepID=UPI002F92B01E